MYARMFTPNIMPGKEHEFVAMWDDMYLPIWRAHPGFVSASLLQCVEQQDLDGVITDLSDKHVFTAVAFWESEDAFKAYKCSDSAKPITMRLRSLVSGSVAQGFEVVDRP